MTDRHEQDETAGLWDDIDAKVAEAEERGAPDPWADMEVGADQLTEEQVAFLEGWDHQPPVPRLQGEPMGEPTVEPDVPPGDRTG